MEKKNNRYIEVKFENNGMNDRCANPLTRQFQYEYALFMLISNMFHSIVCRSRSIESLKLYFMEVPDKSDKAMTKEDIVSGLIPAINRDVLGHITFPMMHSCAAEVTAELEADGSHTFVFSDGIYSFSVHLNKPKNDSPIKIRVSNLGIPRDKTGRTEESGTVAFKYAA